MPDHATIYAPLHLFPRAEQLRPFTDDAADATIDSDGEARATVRWPDLAITISRMPDAQMGAHLQGLQGYVRAHGGGDGLVGRALATLSVYGFVIEPGFDEAGRAMRLVSGITGATDGLCFLDGELYDATGRAMIAEGDLRPDAARVARRAVVLLATAFRGLLEDDAGGEHEAKAEALRQRLVAWLDAQPGVADEVERGERAGLDAPIGRLHPQQRIDMVWRAEGAVVLLWALRVRGLPPHDVSEHPYEICERIGVLEALVPELTAPALREPEELDAMRRRLLGLHWRLREHRLSPEGRVDLAAFARDAWFGGFELDDVPLLDGDLAVCGAALAAADDDAVGLAGSIAVERHHAANWLVGEHPVYSRVTTPT